MNYRPITYIPVQLKPSLSRMNASLQRCKPEAITYAVCASSKGYDVLEKQCQSEFQQFAECLKK